MSSLSHWSNYSYGLSTIFTSALDSNGNIKLVLQATFLSIIVAASFFTLESGAHHLLASQLPEISRLSVIEYILTGFILLAFGAMVFIQILAPVLSSKPLYNVIAIHMRNGFYANALFDRLVGAVRIHTHKNSSIAIVKFEMIKNHEPIEITVLEEQTA